MKHRAYVRVDAYFEIDLDVPTPHRLDGYCPPDKWQTNDFPRPSDDLNDWVFPEGSEARVAYSLNNQTIQAEVEEAIRLRFGEKVGFDGIGEGRFNGVKVEVNYPLPSNSKVRPCIGFDDAGREIHKIIIDKWRESEKSKKAST